MSTLESLLLMILVIDAVALTALILIQQGKGADVGAAFGSGGANTMFGSAGSASFLTKLTAWLGIGFFVISFGLAYSAKERAAALLDEGIPQTAVEQSVPASGNPTKTGVNSTPAVPASSSRPPGQTAGQPSGEKPARDDGLPDIPQL